MGTKRKRESFGSVRRLPSGRWRATYRKDGIEHHAPDTFATAAQARDFLSWVRADISRGAWLNPEFGRYTVKDVAIRWLASNPRKTEATLIRDEGALRRHVYPTLGDLEIATVRRSTIQELVNGWYGSVATIRRQYAVLRALFSYAEFQEWILRSPCKGIKLPERVHTSRRIPTAQDVARIAEAMDSKYAASVLLAAVTGFRWGELFSLRVGDVDLELRKVRLERGLTRTKSGRSVPGAVGSRKARPREVSIPEWLCHVIASHILGLECQSRDAWLFPNRKGNVTQYCTWRNRTWLPALRRAGFNDAELMFGFHDLRRSNATALVARGVDLRTVMYRLGHTTSKLALETYAQPDAEADMAAAEAAGMMLRRMSAVALSDGRGEQANESGSVTELQ